MTTLACQTCVASRGLTIPADPEWSYGTCSLCRKVTTVTCPLDWVHHTHAEPPLDLGGDDGI